MLFKFEPAVWYSFIVIANLPHAGLLLKMPDLRNKPNGKVLLAITLADIYFSAVKIFYQTPLIESKEPYNLYVTVL